MEKKVIKYINDKGQIAKFLFDKELGSGKFGVVYQWHLLECDKELDFPQTLAWKRINFKDDSDYESIIDREVKLCSRTSGKHLNRMYVTFKHK